MFLFLCLAINNLFTTKHQYGKIKQNCVNIFYCRWHFITNFNPSINHLIWHPLIGHYQLSNPSDSENLQSTGIPDIKNSVDLWRKSNISTCFVHRHLGLTCNLWKCRKLEKKYHNSTNSDNFRWKNSFSPFRDLNTYFSWNFSYFEYINNFREKLLDKCGCIFPKLIAVWGFYFF